MKFSMAVKLIKDDFHAFCAREWKVKPSLFTFIKKTIKSPEFDMVLNYRMKNGGIMLKVIRIPFVIRNITKNFHCNVRSFSGGMVLKHAFSTIINAEKIGRNATIYQQVTVGNSGKGCPSIGNDVQISCGAIVLGPISIGDDVIIGAGAVVVKDVPSHSIVVGNPARIIKRRNDFNDVWKTVNDA